MSAAMAEQKTRKVTAVQLQPAAVQAGYDRQLMVCLHPHGLLITSNINGYIKFFFNTPQSETHHWCGRVTHTCQPSMMTAGRMMC